MIRRCGACDGIAIPDGSICPECLVDDFERADIEFDVGFLDLYTEEEIDEINRVLEADEGKESLAQAIARQLKDASPDDVEKLSQTKNTIVERAIYMVEETSLVDALEREDDD